MEIARWLGFGDQQIGYRDEDVWNGRRRNWKNDGVGSCVENDGAGSCVENGDAGSCVENGSGGSFFGNGGGGSFFAVDGGKKMGRWREGGKNLGGSSELK
jgi:hypothetical protein